MRERLMEELAELSQAFGPSGHERAVAGIVQRLLSGIGRCARDRLGNVLIELPGDGPRIMLAAHMDEVGFMVKAVTPEGCLRFVPLGSWWTQVILSGCVRVGSRNGEIRGMIGCRPPHFLKEKERKELVPLEGMFIDVGAGSRADISAMGIRPGDPVVPDVTPVPLMGGEVLMGKAFDDRVGVTAMIEACRRLSGAKHPNTVLAVGSVQEEIGARGARTAAQALAPDACIVLEGTPADDGPGFVSDQPQGVMGGGPQIRICDPSMIANRNLVDLALSEAEKAGLAHQIAVREGGGTDGGQIHLTGAGVPTMVIGIPVRYAHSQAGLCSLADLEKTIELVARMVMQLDGQAVAGLT